MGGRDPCNEPILQTAEENLNWIEAVTLSFSHPTAQEILNVENLYIITINDPDSTTETDNSESNSENQD